VNILFWQGKQTADIFAYYHVDLHVPQFGNHWFRASLLETNCCYKQRVAFHLKFPPGMRTAVLGELWVTDPKASFIRFTVIRRLSASTYRFRRSVGWTKPPAVVSRTRLRGNDFPDPRSAPLQTMPQRIQFSGLILNSS